ncbi:MAG: EAL domain-containing protein [Treponema sp.]|nr:EAL domain-containing protein [Treponema sp.]
MLNYVRSYKKSPVSLRDLSKGQRAIIVAVTVLSFALQGIFLTTVDSIYREKEMNEAQSYAQIISSSVSYNIDKAIIVAKTVKSFYQLYGTDLGSNFNSICDSLTADNPAISAVYVAPQGVITLAYPYESKYQLIGQDAFLSLMYKDYAETALSKLRTTIAGPFNLVAGGQGFVIFEPVYANGRFDSFIIVSIEKNQFVKEVNRIACLNIVGNKDANPRNEFKKDFSEITGYKYGIWKIKESGKKQDDSNNFLVEDEGFLFKDGKGAISRKVVVPPISVPNDYWQLAIVPVKKHNFFIDCIWEILISFLIIIIVIITTVIRQYETCKKQYNFEHDSLTGLYTRSAFYRRCRKLLRDNPDASFDILICDVANFKVLNSIYGHEKCDELLSYIASVFSSGIKDAVCGRYGGDQFILFFNSKYNNGSDSLLQKSHILVENAPLKHFQMKYGFYGSVDRSLPVNLMSDRALTAVKSIAHKDLTIATFDGPVSKRHYQEHLLESTFETAMQNGDFKVWYQPKFDAKTEKIIGAEALVRWIRADGTIVSPADFIYVFEDDGLIVHLDKYVFNEVCEKIQYWSEKGKKIVPISVNVSRTTLHHPGIIQEYSEIVKRTGLSMEKLSLEITESTTFANIQIKSLLEELKVTGFKIDMDDFGSGSSSLASLNMLPFDVLKMDKSLIDYIGTADGDELVRHTIELAHFKKIPVIAEGVEKKEQLDFLRTLNCDYIQGYYYSAPLCYDDFIKLLAELDKEGRV